MQTPIQTKLRALGFRTTPQRVAIYNLIQESGDHLSALEICARVQHNLPTITEATVYRTLSFLTQQGLILAAHIGGGSLVYEIAGRQHHHLICRSCGATHEIDHQLLAKLYQEFQSGTGYCIDSMHVTFFGLCPSCQGQPSSQGFPTIPEV